MYKSKLDGHLFWTRPGYNLIEIGTEPGPALLEFIASDFRNPDWFRFHIALSYASELKNCYDAFWTDHGDDHANEEAIKLFTTCNLSRKRYNGKRVRLKCVTWREG